MRRGACAVDRYRPEMAKKRKAKKAAAKKKKR
jgi:hypothetical protein